MNIFKKQILSIAILAGLGLGCIPAQAQVEKQKVSEMDRFKRARIIANRYLDLLLAPALVAGFSGIGTLIAQDALLRPGLNATFQATCGIGAAIAGGLFGLSLGVTSVLDQIDNIEYDQNFSVSDHVNGALMGISGSIAFPIVFICAIAGIANSIH